MDDEDSEDWKEFEAFSDGLDEQVGNIYHMLQKPFALLEVPLRY